VCVNGWLRRGSLRECIRPLVEDSYPGHDADPRVLVLLSRTVTVDLSSKQILEKRQAIPASNQRAAPKAGGALGGVPLGFFQP